MLALKIISTVFLGISCFTCFIKNAVFFKDDEKYQLARVSVWTFYGWLWRALVITTLWVI